MTEKVIKVIESCQTQEQLECAKIYFQLFCDYMRREHCKKYGLDCEMLEISFDMLNDIIKDKEKLWKN